MIESCELLLIFIFFKFIQINYSDGVGDGQFALCQSFEFPQLKAACQLFDTTYNPDITFIVVQKRVNTRIFSVNFRIYFHEITFIHCICRSYVTTKM